MGEREGGRDGRTDVWSGRIGQARQDGQDGQDKGTDKSGPNEDYGIEVKQPLFGKRTGEKPTKRKREDMEAAPASVKSQPASEEAVKEPAKAEPEAKQAVSKAKAEPATGGSGSDRARGTLPGAVEIPPEQIAWPSQRDTPEPSQSDDSMSEAPSTPPTPRPAGPVRPGRPGRSVRSDRLVRRSVRLFWSVRPVRPHGPSHSPSLVSSPLRVPSPAPAHALYLAPHHLPPLTQHYFQPSPVVRGARRHRAEILEQHVQFLGPTAAAHVPNRRSDPPNHRRHHRTAVYKFCRM